MPNFCTKCDLKSNMDRFIVDTISDIITDVADLKSNMDRFIDNRKIRRKRRNGFKIQYG